MSQTCAVESVIVIAFGFMKTNLITSKFRETQTHHVQLATELERDPISCCYSSGVKRSKVNVTGS